MSLHIHLSKLALLVYYGMVKPLAIMGKVLGEPNKASKHNAPNIMGKTIP
jgi:hypothetical protein